MKTAIAGDLRRTGLADVIASKIQEAIAHFKDEPWYETESSFTVTSVADQREYDFPADFSVLVTRIYVTDSAGTRWPMDGVSIGELEDMRDGLNLTGVSSYYAVLGSQFLVEPIPADATLTFDARYVSNLTAPSTDATEGFWMNEARYVIQHQALGYLWASTIRDQEKAQIEFGLAQQEYLRITAKSEQRIFAQGREVCDE
jgi:hypothetical protein